MTWPATTIVSIPSWGRAAWRALALDGDAEAIRRRHDRAWPDRELADRHARHVVHAVDLLDAEALHQAVLQHGVGAGAAFFGGLEDHDGGAVEIARLGSDIWRRPATWRCDRHGRRHASCRRSRLVGKVGRLLDGQGVHVGAKADDLAARPLCSPRMTPTTPVRPSRSRPRRSRMP